MEAADACEEVENIGQGDDTAEMTGHGGTGEGCRGDQRSGGVRCEGRRRLWGCRCLVGRVEEGLLSGGRWGAGVIG